MSEAKFTPGPWLVDVTWPNNLVRGHYPISGAVGQPHEHRALAQVVIKIDGEEYAQGRSNAALISAAPCLYAALEALCTSGGADDGTDLIGNGLAALAKARGEA